MSFKTWFSYEYFLAVRKRICELPNYPPLRTVNHTMNTYSWFRSDLILHAFLGATHFGTSCCKYHKTILILFPLVLPSCIQSHGGASTHYTEHRKTFQTGAWHSDSSTSSVLPWMNSWEYGFEHFRKIYTWYGRLCGKLDGLGSLLCTESSLQSRVSPTLLSYRKEF